MVLFGVFCLFWGLCFGSDTFWVCFKGLSTHCRTRSLNENIWRILEPKTIPNVYFCRCRFFGPNPKLTTSKRLIYKIDCFFKCKGQPKHILAQKPPKEGLLQNRFRNETSQVFLFFHRMWVFGAVFWCRPENTIFLVVWEL